MKKLAITVLVIMSVIGLIYYVYPEKELASGIRIDELVVIKSERVMYAYSKGELVKAYKISLGRDPVGDKEFQGDKRTPEGHYIINDRNSKSGYYKNLGVSYPNQSDINEAKEKGVDPGGEIKIHGLRNGLGFIGKFHRMVDWTAGCIAVTNQEMGELYDSVGNGTPITIKP